MVEILQENERASAARPLRIGDVAPNFEARSTMGDVSLDQFRGRWLVFFSHPADFTPVCTSEFIALAKAAPQFDALGCSLLGLSVDSLYAHIAWVRLIKASFGVTVPFPIVEDPSMAIGKAYGMVDDTAADSSTVRASYFIDPEGVIRATAWYPLSIGRSVDEMLRMVAALKRTEQGDVMTPEGWHPGGDILLPPEDGAAAAAAADEETPADWFYRLAPDPREAS